MGSLTVTDRCDRCGAQAKVEALFDSGAALLFCGHHYREHQAEIEDQAVTVLNECEWLPPVRSTQTADAP